MFLGGGSTAIVAKGLNRIPMGFELNKTAFDMATERIASTEMGSMLDRIRIPQANQRIYSGKPWTEDERNQMLGIVRECRGMTKKDIIAKVCMELKRGRWGVQNELDRLGILTDASSNRRTGSKYPSNHSDNTIQTTLY